MSAAARAARRRYRDIGSADVENAPVLNEKLHSAQRMVHDPDMPDRDPRRRAPQSKPPTIEAVAAASAIIDLLAERDGTAGVQTVADTLGITKSRASRHLANLELLGIVSRVQTGRGYQLGWRVLRWGQIAAARYNLVELLNAPLRALSEKANQTVLLCAPAGADAIVLQCIPPPTAVIRIEVNIGLVMSLPHSPSARIALAFQPREHRETLLAQAKLRESDFRVDDEERLRGQISSIQRDYYCSDRDKYNVGYGAIAAPVFNQDEALVGIITLVMASDEFVGDTPPVSLVNELLNCCAKSSKLMRSRVCFPGPASHRSASAGERA